MDETTASPKIAENALFTLLGALTAVVLCLGIFGAVDNRAPASIEPTVQESGFDARVYLPFLY